MASKYFLEMQTTDNSGIYKKARKRYLEGRGISCVFCGYHVGENFQKKTPMERSLRMSSLKRRIENGTTTVKDGRLVLIIFGILFLAGCVIGFGIAHP